jgi:hypothetical protein
MIKKYDTKTKLYNIIYYNFQNDIENKNVLIEVEIGPRIYNIREMNKELLLENA